MVDASGYLAAVEAQFLAASSAAEALVETPGFRVHLWATADTFYRTVAVPIAALPDWAPAIPLMRAVFRAQGRRPTVEYLAARWPGLGPALARAGFVCEARLTAMAGAACMLHRAPAGAAAQVVRQLDGATPLRFLGTYLAALHGIFAAGGPTAVGVAEALRLQRGLAAGVTRVDVVESACGGPIAGANLVGIAPVAGIEGPVAELSGVWTAEAVRGRGLARPVVGGLLERFFGAGGGLVWLAAEDQLAAGFYARLGFRPIGRLLRYSQAAA